MDPAVARRRSGGRGAVLAVLVVLSGVMAILVAAVFVLFQANVSSYRYRHGRVRAQLAAEAGATLALYTLALEPAVPEGDPYSMPGDSAQWISLPSGDHAWVVIDPWDMNDEPYRIGSVEIRSRGMSGDVTKDVAVRAAPDYPSRYALLTDMGIPPGIIRDGARIEGPVHSNGVVNIGSMTPDSTGDPWVGFISTTASGGFNFCDVGPSDEPHPDGSRVWLRPYRSHRQGRPYWDRYANEIDFERLGQIFSSLRTAASCSGAVVWNARRILLQGDRLLCLSEPLGAIDTVSLREIDLVYLPGFSNVLIKSVSPVESPLTIVSNGPIGLMGGIYCSMHEATGAPLGLVSLSGFVIPRDPDFTGSSDWPRPWNIETDRHMSINASLCAPSGSIQAEDPTAGGSSYCLNILGGLSVQRLGTLGTGTRGYTLCINYDGALSSTHPPHFPALARWKMYSWVPDPDYGGSDIDDNLF
ncbi:MAG TPA: hypothetical protein PLX54_01595 [Candidatus Fermentibacter daniensis]|nr:MAG: hypothetical protein BWX47_01499 [candidate division Hyd24-12 bacterium ADurb.Bin004]HOF66008.1 hypothetical protein [Candidatus Fermentibacter daniensis]HOR06823.1 hypothetical protein [Candidatus Fermentibacter daniensis]HOZ17049.1 hypothetical protein [Candidatus Fermentibacter daniensis]HPH39883.1 hypothetical protein [Candidatus Fermentibacter daniensis]